MNARLQPHPPRSADEGSVLIMALIFLSFFGLVVGAILTFADTAFRAAASVHVTTEQQYAADAAVEGAINAIRANVTIGKDGVTTTDCFKLPASSVNNAAAVTVDCTGRPGSGAGSVLVGGGTLPSNSVLTLPSNTGEGVILSTGAAPLITGNVLTNQTRAVPAGSSLAIQGSLTCRAATGTGTVTSTTVSCPASPAPSATDPGYAPAVTSAPAPATVPACGGTTITFSPGKYTSAAALNALTGGSCTNRRFHFTPGVYYFEFTDSLPSGTRQWLINDGTAEIVGGTLTATAFPGRCDLAQAGVQFIFGADSRVAVSAGSLELCPPLSAGQRIAVYGPRADTADTASVTTTLTPTTATSTPGLGETANYTPLTSALTLNGAEARWAATVNKGSATLNLTGYSTTAVPANAVITAATVRVASRIENLPAANTPRLTVTAADGTAAVYDPLPCTVPCAAGTVTSINVLAQINTPARANGLSMSYRVEDRQGIPYHVSYVDGAVLDVTYYIPGFKASSGCVTTAPYSPSSSSTCAVLKGTGSTARMAVKGTVYAPSAAVDLSMTGQANEVTQRGIVARTLQLALTRAASHAGALVGMPGAGNRQVLLTARVGGVPRLRADVTFDDGLGSTPGAAVTVTRWSVLR